MSNEEDEKQTLGTGSETGTSYPEDLESDDYTRRATTVQHEPSKYQDI